LDNKKVEKKGGVKGHKGTPGEKGLAGKTGHPA